MSKKFEANWDSLQQFEIPEWYKDAKFGIFIHWGIFSVPAYDNEWYSRNMYLEGDVAYDYHRKTFGEQSKFGYKDFIPMFKAENFDASEWAQIFKDAGARYVIPVAEHHDGFMMYDSALSRWTAAKMGPERDVLGELKQAFEAQGMVVGVSNHRAEHWWFMNGGNEFDSDVQDPEYADFYGPAQSSPRKWYSDDWNSNDWQPRPDKAFLDDWLARCCELVDKYQPSIFYFDWWIQQKVFEPYIQEFAAYYYNKGQEWGKEVAINCKNDAYPDGTVVFDVERGQLGDIRLDFWQTDTTMSNTSWCYVQNHDYKQSTEILHNLIDIVSKNGTLLLNVGPKADGTIPETEKAMLSDIGGWLAANGEAIYSSRPWKIYGEGPTEVIEGEFSDTKREDFTSEDIRFTTQGETLYAIVLGQPENGKICVKSLAQGSEHYPQAIGQVTHLASGKTLEWSRDASGLHCDIQSDEAAIVLKIEQ
mgnify:CR=1 FL=1